MWCVWGLRLFYIIIVIWITKSLEVPTLGWGRLTLKENLPFLARVQSFHSLRDRRLQRIPEATAAYWLRLRDCHTPTTIMSLAKPSILSWSLVEKNGFNYNFCSCGPTLFFVCTMLNFFVPWALLIGYMCCIWLLRTSLFILLQQKFKKWARSILLQALFLMEK